MGAWEGRVMGPPPHLSLTLQQDQDRSSTAGLSQTFMGGGSLFARQAKGLKVTQQISLHKMPNYTAILPSQRGELANRARFCSREILVSCRAGQLPCPGKVKLKAKVLAKPTSPTEGGPPTPVTGLLDSWTPELLVTGPLES